MITEAATSEVWEVQCCICGKSDALIIVSTTMVAPPKNWTLVRYSAPWEKSFVCDDCEDASKLKDLLI